VRVVKGDEGGRGASAVEGVVVR